MGTDTSTAEQVDAPLLKPLDLPTRLAGTPGAPKYPVTVQNAAGEDVVLALVETGQLVRLSPDVLLLSETYNHLVGWVKGYITQHGSVNVAQVRDAFNTSRKYALALLEYLDDQRITKRTGDERVLR